MFAGGESKIPERVVIYLVHGTWGRGLFPTIPGRYRKAVPFWFERRSNFHVNLAQHLSTAVNEVYSRPLLWSGANSINARDVAARRLLRNLRRAAIAHPTSMHVIVAHSHGGNVVLRALQIAAEEALQLPDVRFVSLATPFLRFFSANKEVLARRIAGTALYLSFALYFLANALAHYLLFDAREATHWQVSLVIALISAIVGVLATNLIATGSILPLDTSRQVALVCRSAYSIADRQGYRFLIVRGVDDEATLALGLSAVLAKASTLATQLAVGRLGVAIFWSPLCLLVVFNALALGLPLISEDSSLHFIKDYYYSVIVWLSHTPFDYNRFVGWITGLLSFFMYFYAQILVAFMLLVTLAKGAFGRELWLGSLGMEAAADSAPDIQGFTDIVTLLPAPDDHSLRHSIYNHPTCAEVVARWICSEASWRNASRRYSLPTKAVLEG